MNFKSYPNKKNTPNRKSRKSQRNTVFQFNKSIRAKLNREKRAAAAALNNS